MLEIDLNIFRTCSNGWFPFQVSGLNIKGVGDVSLMERLLNSDTIKHQQKLSKVVRLLRDEFAFDGYMENGIEDLAMGKWMSSVFLLLIHKNT